MSSSRFNGSRFDVFLSFRGKDTCHSFSDHLYDALNRAGISTFRDDEEIDKGEELKPEIERAIKESRSSIIVLSKNYATSSWCLDELDLILDQRRNCNHFTLPVFYHVDPSDVRKQNNSFDVKVQNDSSSRWTDENVSRWKAALTEVANLSGMVLYGSETDFIKEIVTRIYNKLDRKEVQLPLNLIGIETREEEIKSWLRQSDVEFLVICGMGGSGKTTIAKHVLDSNWQKFENISILEDIGKRCNESHGCLLQLQQQLLGDIVGSKRRKILSVRRATLKIEEALQVKKALILLDDIVEPSHLVALLGTGSINKQSKVIVTTTENSIVRWLESRSWRCQEYNMKLLNVDESLKLLCLHAFRSEVPKKGFEELALKVVQYCEGNPLALEVLGSSLHENNTIPYWKSHLKLLEKDMNHKIQHVLMRSYESLPYNSEKELFLHISCFFVGIDKDYVVKILEHDYSALSGIKSLTNRCLLSVSPSKKLIMHRLLQEMGKNIVCQESYKDAAKRSRVIGNDSYEILCKGKGSETIEGLALDMRLLRNKNVALKSKNLKTNALTNMGKLKLLQLNFVELTGPLENFSEDLRWLCWFGFYLRTIPSDLFMRNLVAIDMSCSKLEVFDPPVVLECLQILNLKDSYDLLEIKNIFRLPYLETLIVWNCHNLVHVCETIGGLRSLVEVNLTGCENLWKYSGEHINRSKKLKSSVFGEGSSHKPSLDFPSSLEQLFLKECNIECSDYFPLNFRDQSSLQYLNLGNGLFVSLPNYTHLKNLRVLDLSLCSRLRRLLCLPSTLVELYVYYCESLEIVSFELQQFTLQEFGYEGCSSLSEIEGFFKLVPLAKLNEIDLGHMKWLKEHQNRQIRLVGDDDLTIGRDWCAQMLYEFDIMSTSLPNVMDIKMMPEYNSQSSSLSFEVPSCPRNRRLKGLIVTFKYTLLGDNWAWFAKISTANGVDLMYNPKVFGKPEFGEVCLWLSYWPIGNMLNVGDEVHVSIRELVYGFMVLECGASLVFTDDDLDNVSVENNMRPFGGDLSEFQLSTGAYYLCRRDFFELMEVGRLILGWFRILVGDTIDNTEVRGWRKTGRPQLSNPSITELNTVRCIIHGPEMEDIYKIVERVKSSVRDRSGELSMDEETLTSITTPEPGNAAEENAGELEKNKFMIESLIREEPEDLNNQLHVLSESLLDLSDFEYQPADLSYWFENIMSELIPPPDEE